LEIQNSVNKKKLLKTILLSYSDHDDHRGRDCPIPKEYSIDMSQVPEGASWCTLTSSTENWEEASGLIFHAADISYAEFPPRKA
jgi:hypothetical protein